MNSEKNAMTGIEVWSTLETQNSTYWWNQKYLGQHGYIAVTGERRMVGYHKTKLRPHKQNEEGSKMAKKSTVNHVPGFREG